MNDAISVAEAVKTWEELYMTSATVIRAWEIELAQSGLTLPQALVLYSLVKSQGTPTLQELARMMCREPHSISALVSRMEGDGLVRKKRDPKNSRQVRVLITKKGQEAIRSQLALRATRDIMRRVSKRELDTLHSICSKMRAEAFKLIRDIRPIPYDTPLG